MAQTLVVDSAASKVATKVAPKVSSWVVSSAAWTAEMTAALMVRRSAGSRAVHLVAYWAAR